MKKQRSAISKYGDLLDAHYEIVSELSSLAVTETRDGPDVEGEYAVLKEALEETEAEMAELRAEFELEEFHDVLLVLLE